jgi:DNA-binding SARP family transcriptional activator
MPEVVAMVETASVEGKLSLLGGFGLTVGPRQVSLGVNAQRVLALLALSGRPQTRDVLASRLWPEAYQPRALAYLRTALWRVRQAHPRAVRASHNLVGLGEVEVDYQTLETRARNMFTGGAPLEELAALSHRLFEHELLPGWDEEWLMLDRERYRQLRIHALESLSVQLTAAGQYALAIDTAYAAIGAEPLHEAARAALIQAHLSEGDRAEALRQYATYRDLLLREVGLTPSAELTALLTPPPPLDRHGRMSGKAFIPSGGAASIVRAT